MNNVLCPPPRLSHRATGLLALLLPLVGAVAVLPAQSTSISFESDTYGTKPAGFSSVATPLAQFANLGGGDLQIGLLGTKARGRSLIVFRDDGGGLAITFTQPMNALTLGFGNDDPAFTAVGDQARLTLYRSGAQVGSVTVSLNRNGIMDQMINYSGLNFDRVEFLFTDASGVPLKLTEVIDDVAFAIGPATPPTAPVGLTAVAGNGEVSLQWQAVEDAPNYTVWRAADDGIYYILAGALTNTGYVDQAVTNGTRYSYRVTANNSAGASSAAAVVARPLAALTAADLAAPRVTISGNQLGFSLFGAAGRTYRVQRSTTLAPDSWEDAGPLVPGPGAELMLTHLFDPTIPRQFFRILIGVESDAANSL